MVKKKSKYFSRGHGGHAFAGKNSSLESLISCRWSSTGENQWLSILITPYNPIVRPVFFNLSQFLIIVYLLLKG